VERLWVTAGPWGGKSGGTIMATLKPTLLRRFTILSCVRAGGALLALVAGGCGETGREAPESAGMPAGAHQPVATGSVSAATAPVAVKGTKLIGRWLRPDGGYVLEIRAVDGSTGRMDAVYLNPRPIHVGQAEAKEEGGKLTVFVELQDVGYPGSTYRLTYLPPVDQLIGTYYQPTADQSFDVEFVRMP
jgi:hypothetical protein